MSASVYLVYYFVHWLDTFSPAVHCSQGTVVELPMFPHIEQIENNFSPHPYLIISIWVILILIQHCEKCVWRSLYHQADSDLGMVSFEAFLYILSDLNPFLHSALICYTNKQWKVLQKVWQIFLTHGMLLSPIVLLYELLAQPIWLDLYFSHHNRTYWTRPLLAGRCCRSVSL